MNGLPWARPGWRIVHSVLDRPRRWLAWTLVLTVVPGLGLPRLELRTDGAAVYPAGDPAVELTEAASRAFNDSEQAVVLVTARPGGTTLDSPAGLLYLKRLHSSLASVRGVESSGVRSLASLLDPRPGMPLVSVKTLLDEVPTGGERYRELMERIRRSPLAEGLFLSAGGRAAALYVPAARGQSRDGLLTELERRIARERHEDFELRLTGPLSAEVLLGRRVLRDLGRLVPWMVSVIAVLLWLCLGSPGGMVVAMGEVLLVLTWTLGSMGHCGIPVTLVGTILPVVLTTVAVADEVHVLDRFRHHLAAGGPRAAMGRALRDVARPVVLTSLTTSVAFLSFLTATIAPIRHFGLFTSLGVLFAMALSFTFVPAFVLVLPDSWFAERTARPHRGAPAYERFLVRRRGPVALAGLLLVLASAPGLPRLSVQDSWIDNFDPDSPLVSAERDFNAHFWGSYRLDVVLESEEELFFRRPEGLRLLEELTPVVRAGPHVGGVLSHLTAFEIVAEALEEPGPVSALPPERVSYMAYLLDRIRYRIDLDRLVRYDGCCARLRIFVKSPDYRRGRELEEYLEREISAPLAARHVRWHVSGELPVAGAVVHAIVTNMLASVGWTTAGVGLLLVIAFRSFRAATVVMAPLLAGIPVLLGVMGWAGVPLGIATSMFLAVTVGVAVDFALHFTHAYRRGRHAGLDHEGALEATLAGAGRAIRWNAAVLALGLLVLALSALKPNRSLGLLLSAAMTTCYATTLILLPLLLERSRALYWKAKAP